ncbi:MAG: aspartate kinase [Gemmatimonadota bacterium]
MPDLNVHKFGGAALADADAFASAIDIIRSRPRPVVVVVSAMGGVTDSLLAAAAAAAAGDDGALISVAQGLAARYRAIARSLLSGAPRKTIGDIIDRSFSELESFAQGLATLRELTPRTSDYIVARGERISAQIVAAALAQRRIRSTYVDATDVIRCDDQHGGAAPELAATDRAARNALRPILRRGIIPVVPGFIGLASSGHVATLGRGGSDLTATLIARALNARSATLWKDVPGLLTADPRIVETARIIPQLSRREAAELAYYGAKVLHPRALIPLSKSRTVIFLRPFADPDAPGTEVSERRTESEYPVKALSVVDSQSLVTVAGNGMLGVPGIAARTFGALHAVGVSVALISQASSEHSICFSVPGRAAEQAREALVRAFRDEIRHGEIDGVTIEHDMVIVAVVGTGMAGTPGIAARVFGALAAASINIVAIAQGSSELNISFVVAASQANEAVRRIHDSFQLSRIGGGRIEKRAHSDVILLGFGQIGRSLARMLTRARDGGRVRPRIVGIIDRSGYHFDPQGLSASDVREIAAAKEQTKSSAASSSRTRARASDAALRSRHAAAGASQAIAEMSAHALSRPLLVDVTAADTARVVKQALAAGMDVVLANKRPLGGRRHDAEEILSLARRTGRRVQFEATVGAGLPVIDTFDKLVEAGDRVLRIEGCTSGTLGFILGLVEREVPFSDALRQAIERGYTEPDPRDDLSGADVARKALILGRLIGYRGEPGDVRVESLVPPALRKLSLSGFLRALPRFDARWTARSRRAHDAGGVLRYVAVATPRRVSVGLKIALGGSPFAALRGTDNQIVFTTTRYRHNPLIITGPGAGRDVTAAGVLNDVLKVMATDGALPQSAPARTFTE